MIGSDDQDGSRRPEARSHVNANTQTSTRLEEPDGVEHDDDDIADAVQEFIDSRHPQPPLFAALHDGQVHDPLGAASYAFQDGIVGYTTPPATPRSGSLLPTRPVVIHVGAQPNNSPHAGTLVVFCYAFSHRPPRRRGRAPRARHGRRGGYAYMQALRMDALCSYARLRRCFADEGSGEGLLRIWSEVQRWMRDPRKLFRSFSVEYLRRVVSGTRPRDDN
ncbi:hypothetical protein HIM_07441 [Hirsutella minnesotensis 3608]|uniref:Uncharacterized protein n=1 Tax=Hirsutella minnesotensis 3608 TaxID=1043627 RepID=A0A0F8A4A6_9HYPO|nr:hypothetical protein HIM_07441 [Hirsutella minnesotensis 3608]